MTRSALSVVLLAVLPLVQAAVGPGAGTSGALLAARGPLAAFAPAPVLAAAQCTGWSSQSTPPPAIRVLRTSGPAAGTVQSVPFEQYVTVVMAAEWGPNDPPEALKAGAVAVKEYAWYHAIYWRGGTAADGSCYDVVDSSLDQVYAPETETPSASEIAAVDATWGESLLKSGALFATHYDGGSSVACGANADGWHLYQISAMRCARNGMLADAILQTYYSPNLVIVGGNTAPPATGVAAALGFSAQPAAGAANVPFPVQPIVRVVDATGQVVATGAGASVPVTLSLAGGPPGAALSCTGGPTRAALAGVAAFAGCAVSMPGTGYVLVASAAGLPSAASAPFALSAPTPTLSLTATDPVIRWSAATTLRVQMTPSVAEETVSGLPVHVQSSPDGQTWTTIADLVTDVSGAATLSWRPATNLWYRSVFDGAAELGPASSPAQRVLVRQLALLRPDNGGSVRHVARGATVSFSTVVRPARPDLPPGRVLYRAYALVGRAWTLQRESVVTADSAGRAGLTISFARPGQWYVRAMALPTARNANSLWSPVERYLVS